MKRHSAPPEDFFCQDLNCISIVPPPRGRRGKRDQPGLDQGAKRLVSRVMALSRGRPCTASNKTLAWWLGASVPSVSRWIGEATRFGILTVELNGGRRRLSINADRLTALKAAYLSALADRKRSLEELEETLAEANQLDKGVPEKPDQVDKGGHINLISLPDQIDMTPNQVDHQLNNGVKEGRRKEDNNGPSEEGPGQPLLFLLDKIAIKEEEERASDREIKEAKSELDEVEAELYRLGQDKTENPQWVTAFDRHQALMERQADIEIALMDLRKEAQQEEERARLDAERLRQEAERLRLEAELDAWRGDPQHRIIESPEMVLEAFQWACQKRFSGRQLLFPARDGQIKQAQGVLDFLMAKDCLNEAMLRWWIDWYPQHSLNDQSPDYHITIRNLTGSWVRFRREVPWDTGMSRERMRDLIGRLRLATDPSTGSEDQP